ncbi:MAG TPA: UDP-N-acetylmuramoyl-tripeptide--D-alanyl-D-alanine ligase [Stellaceae bacterium]|nr:UDP-N-acetylmuramoyl-tripeptide--D-alanyl-D-alanine ligase [Stellaceae bacterium]
MIPIFAFCGFLIFAWRRLLTYLHLFQQEEYDDRRFLAWLWRERAFDRRMSLLLLVFGIADLGMRFAGVMRWGVVALVVFVVPLAFERDPRKSAKKPLVMTARARRIYWVALGVCIAIGLAAALTSDLLFIWIAAVQLVPVALVAGNLLLAPFEARVQRSYWRDARAILQRVNPTVIAVTGSYGKTSVKHILGHVLETAAPTLITPGSVNTAMGIARVIRERLQPHHRYFVVEMGAYGIGSIARLCALTPPRIGIVSAIGKAHYERFKSLDAVSRAKFELAEAVRDNHGRLIVASDVLEFDWPRQFVERHRDIVVTVGADADLAIHRLRQDADGIVAEIEWRGEPYRLAAPLYGLHQGRNIALAFAAACSLGLAPEDVIASLKSTPQIAHRLEVKRQGEGAVVIDDAYNSNPVGFASALALLDTLRRPDGRRILVTPGMAELGSEHEAEHARIGRLAAEHADMLLAVAPHRVAPLAAAFREAAPERPVVSCATFADAKNWLDGNLGRNDVVLIENDLPDLLERKLRL